MPHLKTWQWVAIAVVAYLAWRWWKAHGHQVATSSASSSTSVPVVAMPQVGSTAAAVNPAVDAAAGLLGGVVSGIAQMPIVSTPSQAFLDAAAKGWQGVIT